MIPNIVSCLNVKYALYDLKSKGFQSTFNGSTQLYDTERQARVGRIKLIDTLRKLGVKHCDIKIVKVIQTTEIIEILKC